MSRNAVQDGEEHEPRDPRVTSEPVGVQLLVELRQDIVTRPQTRRALGELLEAPLRELTSIDARLALSISSTGSSPAAKISITRRAASTGAHTPRRRRCTHGRAAARDDRRHRRTTVLRNGEDPRRVRVADDAILARRANSSITVAAEGLTVADPRWRSMNASRSAAATRTTGADADRGEVATRDQAPNRVLRNVQPLGHRPDRVQLRRRLRLMHMSAHGVTCCAHRSVTLQEPWRTARDKRDSVTEIVQDLVDRAFDEPTTRAGRSPRSSSAITRWAGRPGTGRRRPQSARERARAECAAAANAAREHSENLGTKASTRRSANCPSCRSRGIRSHPARGASRTARLQPRRRPRPTRNRHARQLRLPAAHQKRLGRRCPQGHDETTQRFRTGRDQPLVIRRRRRIHRRHRPTPFATTSPDGSGTRQSPARSSAFAAAPDSGTRAVRGHNRTPQPPTRILGPDDAVRVHAGRRPAGPSTRSSLMQGGHGSSSARQPDAPNASPAAAKRATASSTGSTELRGVGALREGSATRWCDGKQPQPRSQTIPADPGSPSA